MQLHELGRKSKSESHAWTAALLWIILVQSTVTSRCGLNVMSQVDAGQQWHAQGYYTSQYCILRWLLQLSMKP